MKGGREERREEGRDEGMEGGREKRRKKGRKEGREGGRKGRKGRKEGRKGVREEGRDRGGREVERERGREEGREWGGRKGSGREGGRKGGREEGRNKGMKGGCWQKKGKAKSQHSEIIGFSILESTQCMVPHTDLDLPKGLHPSYTLPSQHCSTWLSYQLWHSSKEKQKTEMLKAAWKSKYFEFHLNMSENQVEYMLCCCTVQNQMPYRHEIASRLLHLNEEKRLCNSPLPVYSVSQLLLLHMSSILSYLAMPLLGWARVAGNGCPSKIQFWWSHWRADTWWRHCILYSKRTTINNLINVYT